MGITSSLSNESKKYFPIKEFKKGKIKTKYRCILRSKNKIITLKNNSVNDIDIYKDEEIIKDGKVFEFFDTKKESSYILNKISVYFSTIHEDLKLKIRIPNLEKVIFEDFKQGESSEECILYENKEKDMNFYYGFCGIDKIKIVKYNQDSYNSDDILEIYSNKEFLKLYCKNLDSFTKQKKKNMKNIKVQYHPFYYKEEGKEKIFLYAKAIKEFEEFLKERVLDYYKYDYNLKDITFMAFKTTNINKKSSSCIGLNINYYEIFEGETFVDQDFII